MVSCTSSQLLSYSLYARGVIGGRSLGHFRCLISLRTYWLHSMGHQNVPSNICLNFGLSMLSIPKMSTIGDCNIGVSCAWVDHHLASSRHACSISFFVVWHVCSVVLSSFGAVTCANPVCRVSIPSAFFMFWDVFLLCSVFF